MAGEARGTTVRIAYFDCSAGISGDMTLGALVDAGVDPKAILDAVGSLGLPGEVAFETVKKNGFRATHAKVVAPVEAAHRYLHQIESMIDAGALTPRQADLAKRIFRRLGEAEAAAHGTSLRRVHFHEVGAVDSIIDIVGAAVGLDLLGVDRIEAGAVPPGRGWVRAEHGRMPLPAPATAILLTGIPMAESTAEMEQTTPTGAAILATVVDRFGPLPAMTVESIGLGAGTRDVPEFANVLRLFVGEAAPAGSASATGPGPATDRVWVLETNLDDVPGEVVAFATTRIMAAGALDAFVTPVLMKKNRPGVVVTVLCDAAKVSEMESILFRETGTLGVRRHEVARRTLSRRATEVPTPYGPVRGKLGWSDDRPPSFSPEFEDCARVASSAGVPLREVYRAAHSGYASTTPPAPAPAPGTPQPGATEGRPASESAAPDEAG